jgi:hypothetical protein
VETCLSYKVPPPCVVGFCTCFMCLCLGLLVLYHRVGKFVKLCAFKLYHRASTSSCDDLLQIYAYYLVKNIG